MEIKTLEMAGLYAATQALRLPYNKPSQSKGLSWTKKKHMLEDEIRAETNTFVYITNKDLLLMETLKKRGDVHAKVLRGIIVWAEIKAPVYFWCEAETYRAGHERLCSESTMHGVAKGLTGDELVKVKSDLPMGTMLKKVDYFSYQCLRNIYIYRHDHRLPEWQQFCKWIEGLPFAKELILNREEDRV